MTNYLEIAGGSNFGVHSYNIPARGYHRPKNGEEDNVWTKFYFVTQPGGLKQYFPVKKK